MNKNIPSKIASYNCDGCLGILSTNGKITPQIKSVGFPTSSLFIKFAILPKKIPIGAATAMKSKKIYFSKLFFLQKITVAIIIPIKPP